MTLSDEKTTIVHASEGFDFLGVRTSSAPQRSNPSKILPYQVPAQKSVKAYRQKVKELTHPNLDYMPPGERIRSLELAGGGMGELSSLGKCQTEPFQL